MADDALVFDEDLAKLVSYLTFDGHLGKNLTSFYLSSSNFVFLKDFENIVVKKFGLKPHYEKGTGFGLSYKCKFYNAKISRLLFRAGVPKGDKMLVPFKIPDWVKANRNYSKAYLAVAFQCEGWIAKKSKTCFSVSFKIYKAEKLLADGIDFVEDLKSLLGSFGISTSRTWFGKGNVRKDGNVTRAMQFCVRAQASHIFKKEIGFGLASDKNLRLDVGAAYSGREIKARKNSLSLIDGSGQILPEKWRVVVPDHPTKGLARLIAYVMRYGSFTRNFKQVSLISSSKDIVKAFALLINREFGLIVPYARKNSKSYRCIVCCIKIGRWLAEQGFKPTRREMASSKIPNWILDNPEYSKEFFGAYSAI